MGALKNRITVRLTNPELERLAAHAKESGLAPVEIARLALARYFEGHAAQSTTVMRSIGDIHHRLHMMGDYLNGLHAYVTGSGEADKREEGSLKALVKNVKALQQEQLSLIDALTDKRATS
jgi:hypothetical protein